jgi:ABC-type antimicrobial peptide transport system permease subunit
MLLNYLRLTFRTLLKNKAPFLINLIGMSIALGCCITAYVNYEFNVNFDKTQAKASQIYRVSFWNESEGKMTPYGVCPIPMGALIRENMKEADVVVRYISKGAQFRIGDEIFASEFINADPEFLELFSMERLHGSLNFSDKSTVLMSDKLALRYFGTTDAVGKPLSQVISGEIREFTIGGVYKTFPSNSSFRFDLISTFDNYFVDPTQQTVIGNDWKKWSTVFLQISDPGAISRLEQQLQSYLKVQNEARPDLMAKSFYIESFVGMAQRAVKQRNQGHWLNMPMPPAAVLAPFFMAGFLLLVACFNFTNNSIAVAGKRLKEIGIRKVVGGRRKELIIQFLSETLVFALIALGLSLFLAEYLVAGWDSLWPSIELSVRYRDNLPFFVVLTVLVVFTALLAGGYPAFYISSFRPIQVLRDKIQLGGMNWFTKSLLVAQFSISLAAVIFAIAFYFNSKFQKSYDLGYSYNNVIQVPVENGDQYNKLQNVLVANRLIHSIAGSQHHIYSNSMKAAAKTELTEEKEVDVLNVGDSYFNTLNVRMISGRGFEKDRASDLKEGIVVNEEFVRYFKLTDPLGKRVTLNDTLQYYITGVVKDVYLQALFQPLAPLAFRHAPEADYRYLVVSTDPEKLLTVNDQIKSEWKKLFPASLYTGKLMEERMVMAMEHFDNVVIIYTFLGLVAIIMSVSGLFGLVSLNLQRRTKELGIRKILGASVANIMLQASKLFLVVMLVSFVVGSIMGSFMVNKMMDSVWEYYVAIDIKVISLAVLILFFIASATIFTKILTVTVSNPSDALRHE